MTEENVVVGASGTEGCGAAIRYAAAEAGRHDVRLEIVHVVPESVPPALLHPTAAPFRSVEMEAIGRSILEDARAAAAHHLPPDRIDLHLTRGDRVAALLGRVSDARCLVLGDDRSRLLSRIATGSTVAAVAGRAQVPIVVVPSDWTPGERRHRVAVGVKGYVDLPVALVKGALALAAQDAASLEIVHAWDPPAPYSELVLPPLAAPGWAATVEREIRSRSGDVLAEFPDTKVVVSALYGDPTSILQHVSTEVDIVVIARRARALPTGHFGSVGRALLRGMQCPLVVLPVAESDGETP